MKILLATIVYDNYIDIFESVLLRSLKQSGNIPRLVAEGHEIRYYIYTRNDHNVQRVRKTEIEGVQVEVFDFDEIDNHDLLKKIIEQSIGQNARLLFMSPDYFIGNGSIYNICKYSSNDNMCISALHMRVDYDKFLGIMNTTDKEISNPELVTLAMENLHKSWGESFVDVPSNNAYYSGSSIQSIADKLWSVCFRIPTVFLAKFEADDLRELSQFDHWDWEWPSFLIENNRYKYIGSSDMFFAVELTKVRENIPAIKHDGLWNDEFRVCKKHGEINKNFLSILRGE